MIPVEIAARLRVLAEEMSEISGCMGYYGGFSAEWGAHSRELAGAGDIARQWADEIEKAAVKFCKPNEGDTQTK